MPFYPSDTDADKFMQEQLAAESLDDEATDATTADHQATEVAEDDTFRRESTRLATKTQEAPLEQQSLMIRNADRQAVFRYFQSIPTPRDGTEAVIYQHLEDIADSISNANVTDRSRNELFFRCCPNKHIVSDIDGSNNQIDACISTHRTVQNVPRLEAHNIAVVFEFKLNNAPELVVSTNTLTVATMPTHEIYIQIQNNQQAVSANVQIMNDDLRRTSAFGVSSSPKVSLVG